MLYCEMLYRVPRSAKRCEYNSKINRYAASIASILTLNNSCLFIQVGTIEEKTGVAYIGIHGSCICEKTKSYSIEKGSAHPSQCINQRSSLYSSLAILGLEHDELQIVLTERLQQYLILTMRKTRSR